MMNTPNIGLSLDTLGYVRLRQAYVHNMRVIGVQTGLSLPTNIIGDVLFRRNVRENLAKIATHLGMPAPPQYNNIDELRRILAAAMVRIDAVIGGGAPLRIAGTPPTSGQVGVSYLFNPSTSGGTGVKVFTLAGGVLLAGLSLDTATGEITGTPMEAGSMDGLSVRVSDDGGDATTSPTTVTIAAASSSNQMTAGGVVMTAGGEPMTAGAY